MHGMTNQEHPCGLNTFNEFWPYFLAQHSKKTTKALHAAGTLIAFILTALGVIRGEVLLIIAAFVTGYSFSWASHFFVERNRPAAFRYPIWSFFCSLRMTWGVLTSLLRHGRI